MRIFSSVQSDVTDRAARDLGFVRAYDENLTLGALGFAGFDYERAPAIAGQTQSWRLNNPAGSTRGALTTAIEVLCNAARTAQVHIASPAAGDLATALTEVNRSAGGAAAQVAFSFATGQGVIGNQVVATRAQAAVPYVVKTIFELPINSTLQVDFRDGTIVVGDRMSINVAWVEGVT